MDDIIDKVRALQSVRKRLQRQVAAVSAFLPEESVTGLQESLIVLDSGLQQIKQDLIAKNKEAK